MTTPRPGYDIDAWRRRIPLLASCIPMNNCSQAPQTDATRAAAERYLDSWNRSGMDWDAWMAEVALAKNAFAKLIGATPSDVAVFGSVSAAASAVASALDLDGDRQRIVVSGMEFPGVAHVWLAQGRRGAQLCRVPVHNDEIDPGAYDSLINERTALVSACHGWYMNGFVQDVAHIAARARAAGALSFVDAYQTLGAVPVNVPRPRRRLPCDGHAQVPDGCIRDRVPLRAAGDRRIAASHSDGLVRSRRAICLFTNARLVA